MVNQTRLTPETEGFVVVVSRTPVETSVSVLPGSFPGSGVQMVRLTVFLLTPPRIFDPKRVWTYVPVALEMCSVRTTRGPVWTFYSRTDSRHTSKPEFVVFG